MIILTLNFAVPCDSIYIYSNRLLCSALPLGPCQPVGLTVSGSCDNETVTLDWVAAQGASLYTVTAAGDLGYVTSFQTNETMGEVELPCGQLFTFTVVANDDRCDSVASLPEEFKTGESTTSLADGKTTNVMTCQYIIFYMH